MKKNNDVFSFTKLDSNDWKHLAIGLAGYIMVLYIGHLISTHTGFDLSLRPHEIALMATFAAAFIWEFAQMWISKARINIKDIFISCFLPLCISVYLWM